MCENIKWIPALPIIVLCCFCLVLVIGYFAVRLMYLEERVETIVNVIHYQLDKNR